jgi:uncharacterized protein YoxC
MADQQLKIRIEAIDNATKALTEVKNQLKGLSGTTDNLSSSFFTLKNAVLAFATGATINGVINQTKKFQDLQTTLSRVTGSVENGTQVLNYLIDSTKKSTFSVQDLANSYITLSTAGINPTERLLRIFTDTASASTDQLDTLNDLTRLFAKGVQGGLGLQALNQLVSKGIPAFKILENELGLSKDGIEKFAETTRGANKILDALLNGLEKSFTGATEARANNLSVALSRISKEADLALLNIGKNGLTQSINDLADSISYLNKEGEPLLKFLGGLSGAVVDTASGALLFFNNVLKDLRKEYNQFANEYTKLYNKITGKRIPLNVEGTTTSPTEITGVSAGLPMAEVKQPPILDYEIVLKRVIEDNQNKIDRINDSFSTTQGLTKTITETLNAGIGDFSQKLAESIVLGKQLEDVFRNLAQSLLVSILKQAIELIAREALNYFWKQLQTTELFKQLAVEKQITAEKIRQSSVTSSSGGGGFLGSLFTAGFNLIAGGGSVPFDAPNLYNPVMEAEGGALSAGNPYMVGERGRELFIPSTNGTMIPNHDLRGGSNITFNIQANDVRGIKELLIDNRATIINLVNQGANQKGKSNIV